MKKINPKDLNDNVFEAIGKEWMLLTAGKSDNFNLMTASWGGIGWLWNKPVAFVFIRPERYTFEFAELNDSFSISFLGTSKEARDIHKICGTKSGRDINKVEASGLILEPTEQGDVIYKQSRITLIGRKLYADFLKPECFYDSTLRDKWYSSSEEAKKGCSPFGGKIRVQNEVLAGACGGKYHFVSGDFLAKRQKNSPAPHVS